MKTSRTNLIAGKDDRLKHLDIESWNYNVSQCLVQPGVSKSFLKNSMEILAIVFWSKYSFN